MTDNIKIAIFNIEDNLKNNSGIYEIINLLNGKNYIGSTIHFKNRFKGHMSRFKKNINGCRKLYNAMHKYGAENFIFNIKEIVPKELVTKEYLIEREQYWINQGTNYNIRKKAESNLGCKHSKKSKTKICGVNHHSSKAITQYTLNGIKIRDFDSMKEAYKIYGSRGHLEDCCNGKAISYFGYRWSFKNCKLNNFDKKPHIARQIIQYTLEGEKIREFDNANKAAIHLGIYSGAHIEECCKGKRNKAYNCKWSYKINN